MRATLISLKTIPNKPNVVMPCFRLETGKSANTYLDKTYGNYRRWQPFLKVGMVFDGLIMKTARLVDADSLFTVVK